MNTAGAWRQLKSRLTSMCQGYVCKDKRWQRRAELFAKIDELGKKEEWFFNSPCMPPPCWVQCCPHQPCAVLCISIISIFSYLNLKAHNWTFDIPFSSKTFKLKYFFNFMWLSDDFFWVGLFFNWKKKSLRIKYVKFIKTNYFQWNGEKLHNLFDFICTLKRLYVIKSLSSAAAWEI